MIDDIYSKGFVKFREPDGLSLIELDKFRLLNVEERSRDNGVKDVDPELSSRMTLFAHHIKGKYVDPFWKNAVYNKFIVWEGIDKDNQGWHTDMFEGYDVFFLYYFDTQHSETGGSINFKWKDPETGEEKTESHYPVAGDLFMVSNCRGFWHRAESTTIRRRIASFDFNVGLEEDD
jgi:hypothetical protein